MSAACARDEDVACSLHVHLHHELQVGVVLFHTFSYIFRAGNGQAGFMFGGLDVWWRTASDSYIGGACSVTAFGSTSSWEWWRAWRRHRSAALLCGVASVVEIRHG